MLYEIVPNRVYLSNFPDASREVQRDMFVFNWTANLPMVGRGIRIAVNDDLQQDSIQKMTRSLPIAVPYIDKYKRVLVHCAAGQQRSATVVAAYLMYKYNYTVPQAIQYIKSKKPDAFLDGVHFENSLKDYYLYLHKND